MLVLLVGESFAWTKWLVSYLENIGMVAEELWMYCIQLCNRVGVTVRLFTSEQATQPIVGKVVLSYVTFFLDLGDTCVVVVVMVAVY